jgi:hypothetical protein
MTGPPPSNFVLCNGTSCGAGCLKGPLSFSTTANIRVKQRQVGLARVKLESMQSTDREHLYTLESALRDI